MSVAFAVAEYLTYGCHRILCLRLMASTRFCSSPSVSRLCVWIDTGNARDSGQSLP